MNAVQLMEFLTRELMALTGVSECLSAWQFDVTREQYVMRWHGGGKVVGQRVPAQCSQETAEQQAAHLAEIWKLEEAGPEEDYERLKREFTAGGMPWRHERRPPDAEPQQIA
jgi:hypothetical protein